MQQDSDATAIIGPQSCRRVGRTKDISLADRLASDTQRNGIQMGHQQAPRTTLTTWQFDDQTARVAAVRTASLRVVNHDRRFGQPGLQQTLADELDNFTLLAALAGYRHQLLHQL